MTSIDASELLRRLTELDAHLATSEEFERQWPLALEPPITVAEIEAVEAKLGAGVPEPWRALLTRHAGGGRFCFSLKADYEGDYDDTPVTGGFEMLSPAAMLSEHARILGFADVEEAQHPFVPLLKDPSAATWLCAMQTPRGMRIALVHHDGELDDPERWPVDEFFDGWTRAGCPIDLRWEDQAEAAVERFCKALGIEGESDE